MSQVASMRLPEQELAPEASRLAEAERSIAGQLGCNLDDPSGWPRETIDQLMAVYAENGAEELCRQLQRLMAA